MIKDGPAVDFIKHFPRLAEQLYNGMCTFEMLLKKDGKSWSVTEPYHHPVTLHHNDVWVYHPILHEGRTPRKYFLYKFFISKQIPVLYRGEQCTYADFVIGICIP